MKRIIIIIVVLAAIGGVIVLKKTGIGKKKSLCPCKVLETAETNQTEVGTADVE